MSSGIIKQLLESGAHFGHRTRKWDPKMGPYIFGERNGVHIIDLKKTVQKLDEACRFIAERAERGEEILFVGTKKQARECIAEEATRVGSPYVSERWLGGMLTNFDTIRQSMKKLADIETMEEDGTINLRPKKEILKLRKLSERLTRNLEGIKNLKGVPGVVVVVDVKQEAIAIQEARKLCIPLVGIVDTDSNPNLVDICIPSNDDAIKSNRLILFALTEAANKGKQIYIQMLAEQEAKRAAEEAERKAEEERQAKAKAKKEAELKKAAEEKKAKEEAAAPKKEDTPKAAASADEPKKAAVKKVVKKVAKKTVKKEEAAPVKEAPVVEAKDENTEPKGE